MIPRNPKEVQARKGANEEKIWFCPARECDCVKDLLVCTKIPAAF